MPVLVFLWGSVCSRSRSCSPPRSRCLRDIARAVTATYGGGGELYSQDRSTVGRVPEGKHAGNQAGGKEGVERGASNKRPMRGRNRSSLQYDDTVERIAAAAYPLYQQHLRASGKLDFGDLLLCTVHLL